MTDDRPTPERQLPVDQIIARYRQQLAQANERVIVAEVTAEEAERHAAAAEAEAATLRLRLIALEEQATGE